MKKYAVIDIGSNSVRLLLVADGKVLYKRLKTTRLGENLAVSGTLLPKAISRSATAVAEFYHLAKKEGAEDVLAFATASVRFAKNGGDFLLAVKELCPLQVEVISGETEAEIGVLGALGNSDGAVLDIGGASTELIVRKKGECVYKKSLDIGAVRLKDICGRDREKLEKVCKKAVESFGEVPKIDTLTAIGGTATTLCAVALGLEDYDGERVTGATVSKARLQTLINEFFQKSVEEIAKLPCISAGREDIITGGAVLFSTVIDYLGLQSFCASDRDNLEGYAVKKGYLV